MTDYVAGKISVIPDLRLNTLIVICPRNKLANVARLIEELDKPKSPDIKTRMIEIKHMDADSISAITDQLSRLFDRGRTQSDKDRMQIVPYSDGNRIIVLSSQANFDLVKQIGDQIDTEASEQRETRTYPIKELLQTA